MSDISAAITQIEKQFGKGSIIKLGDKASHDVSVISTGSISIDHALGIGGFPRGRISEISGPEMCLDRNTFVQFEVRATDGRRINHKGGTIERLFRRMNGLYAHGGLTQENVKYYAPSVNEDGRIFQNEIKDVVMTGFKECFVLGTTDGQKIIATAYHKFMSGSSFARLGDLRAGDTVYIHNSTPFTVDEYAAIKNREYVYVKAHGVAGIKFVEGGKYKYYRLMKSRAIIEAVLNNLSFEEYVNILNTGDISSLKFLDRSDHVHHVDENVLNNDLDNLVVIPAGEHGRLHATERHNNLRYMAVPAIVAFIEPVGIRETYDIKMLSPFNNFVADGFVVHNSGKTTLALQIVAEAQKVGGTAAYIDVEHALDPGYAKNLGVNTDELLVSQPDYGEQALEIVNALVDSCGVDVIVIDSVAALVPKAELDGEMGDSFMGVHARLMSQAMRKLTGPTSKTNTCLIFINQIREKFNVMFGSPETQPGGRALKFYSSVRVDIRRLGQIKDGEEILGNKTKVKIVKNKMAPPFKEVELDIIYGEGISKEGDVLDMGVEHGVVEKGGAWYSYKGERLGQGRDNSRQFLKANANVFAKIDLELRAVLGL